MYKKNLSSESQFLFSDAYLAAHELTFDTELSYISMDCLRDSGLTFNLGGHHFMFDADTMTVKETVVEGRLYTLVDLKEGCGARYAFFPSRLHYRFARKIYHNLRDVIVLKIFLLRLLLLLFLLLLHQHLLLLRVYHMMLVSVFMYLHRHPGLHRVLREQIIKVLGHGVIVII
jgi:hypothetical protein